MNNKNVCGCKYCNGKLIGGSQIVPFVNYYFDMKKDYGKGIKKNSGVIYSNGRNSYLRTSNNTIAFALGKERSGSYRNMFNLIGGKNDDINGCGIRNALREYEEEAKIKLSMSDFEKLNKKFIFLPIRNTNAISMVIFIETPRLSLRTSNIIIDRCNRNVNLKWCEREMECLTWVFSTKDLTYFDLNSGEVLHKGVSNGISTFAASAISKFYGLLN